MADDSSDADRDPDTDASAAQEPAAGPQKKRRTRSFWVELPVLVLVALGAALLIKAFLLQAFFIPSGSMEQTLHGCPGCTDDRVLVNKLVYDFRSPHRGEIVVFDGAGSFEPEVPGSSQTDFIKRVIGVGGDTVACCTEGHVTVTPKGSSTPVVLHEPYIYQDGSPCGTRAFGPVTVPDDRLWVMGDHRGDSVDSRCHQGGDGGGTVPVDEVIGKAFVVIYPFSRIGLLHTPATFSQSGLQASGPTGTAGDGRRAAVAAAAAELPGHAPQRWAAH